VFSFSVAQETKDEQLAAQYYQNGEFDKAADLYEKLFNKTGNPFFYNFYLNSLLELKEYKTAEKTVKKIIKKFPDDLRYPVDLGYVYLQSNEPDKAKKEFEGAINKLGPDQQQIFNLASAFITRQQLDYAISAYQKGRKLLKDIYPFNFELADLYNAKMDYVSMVNEYLDVLQLNDSYLQSVQNALQTSIGEDTKGKKSEILKNQLIKRTQSQPDKQVYADMLIWMYVQEKDFEAAFLHTKALDKRLKMDGGKLMALATLAVTNQNYGVAVKCYEYVITKGPQNYYYTNSKMELLNVLNQKITSSAYTASDLTQLETQYRTTLAELGKGPATAPLIKNFAHLLAFYLNKIDEGISLMDEVIAMPSLTPKLKAECKLELGDMLLLNGEIWEASLLYSQVEKAFHEDILGQEAKFKNARLSYFKGEFEWAQAQLSVLKAATSKLIANDALELSLLITDNTGLDSIIEPLMIFSRSELLSFQNKDDEALLTLDSITQEYPGHSLEDEILFKKYKIYKKAAKFDLAAENLNKIMSDYGTDILADDAIFYLAELNETQFKNLEKAQELYQELLVKHPGSLYSVEARKRFRRLRGDMIN